MEIEDGRVRRREKGDYCNSNSDSVIFSECDSNLTRSIPSKDSGTTLTSQNLANAGLGLGASQLPPDTVSSERQDRHTGWRSLLQRVRSRVARLYATRAITPDAAIHHTCYSAPTSTTSTMRESAEGGSQRQSRRSVVAATSSPQKTRTYANTRSGGISTNTGIVGSAGSTQRNPSDLNIYGLPLGEGLENRLHRRIGSGWTCYYCKTVVALGEPHGCWAPDARAGWSE